MDAQTAQDRLERMVAAGEEPILDALTIVDLLAQAARRDFLENDPRNGTAAAHATGTLYAVNDIVQQAALTERWWICEVPGTTGATAPTWPAFTYPAPASGSTVWDGTVVWRDAGSRWQPTYDLNAAAALGWEQKAAACSHRFNFSADSQRFDVSQIHAQCLTMADRFRNRGAFTIRIET